MNMIDVVVTINSENSDELLQILRKESSLEAESYKSVGVEGDGSFMDVIATLSEATLGFFIGVITSFHSKQTLKVTIGETTIEMTSRRTEGDLENIINKAYEFEVRRLHMQNEIEVDFWNAIRKESLSTNEVAQLERQVNIIAQKNTPKTSKYNAITRIFNLLNKRADHTASEDLDRILFYDKQGEIIRFDTFLSFAEEDVETAYRIYSELTKKGLKVWFSREHLKYGQSILGVITKVIQNSNSGIVLLSASTFSDDQHFPIQELKTLQDQHRYRNLLLFPIYHGITHDYILDNYPMLSDLYACNTQQGLEAISEKFLQELKKHMTTTKRKKGLNE